MAYHRLAALLIIIMLTACLCGCSRIEQLLTAVLEAENPAQQEEVEQTIPEDIEVETFPAEIYTVERDYLAVFAEPGEGQTQVGYLSSGDSVAVYEVMTVDTKQWGRTDGGWISMESLATAVQKTEPTDVPTVPSQARMGITTGDYLNVRTGPGTQYDVCDSLRKNVRIQILETSGNWGRTPRGWVYLDYVYIDGTYGPDPAIMGSIKGTDVNIRSGPGTEYEILGSTNTGDRYLFLYQVRLNGRRWGCTSSGWICMDYVVLDTQVQSD